MPHFFRKGCKELYLGLAITERAVHRHGGTVRARNAVDGGRVVEITLPSAPAKPF